MRFIGRGMGRQRIGIALIFALVLAGLVTVGHATTAPPDVAISMQGFKFIGPDDVDGNVTIPVGTKITWTMNDGVPIHHTSTSDTGSAMAWDSGALSTGQTFSLVFPTVGSFGYHCIFHPVSMFGTITVVAPPPNPTGVTPSTGGSGGGTNVTITGTDFQAGATVTFGGVAATNINVVDANTITATTPAHVAGAFDIIVTNPDSTAGTLSLGFTFVAPNPLPQPKPSVAPISGANPLPAQRSPGPADSGSPNPLPGGRPAGGGAASGTNITAPGASAPAPAPLPLPARR